MRTGSRPGGSTTSRSANARRVGRQRARRCPARPRGLGAAALRRSPVELLEEQAKTRVPELVPIRYGRMLVSPFTFYRGAAYLMASDLAGMPRTGLHTQLCGDAHLSNFGAFAAPDRRLVFSINDFDETLPGTVRVGREAPRGELRRRGPRPRLRRQGAGAINIMVGRAYREAIAGYAGQGNLESLVFAHRRRRQFAAQWRRRRHDRAAEALRAQHREDEDEDQPESVREADRGCRRRTAHRQRPAGGRPDRGARRRPRPHELDDSSTA